jgi:hypothetical protein
MDDAAAAPAVDEQVAFALTPATHVVGPLNFAKSEHHKIYKSGIKAIDTTYDCEPEGLFQFLREIRDRANQMGWMEGVLNIDLAGDDIGFEEISNLIDNYGTITLEQVAEWEKSYIATPSRAAQDTYMLYQCLMSSLAPEAKKKIMIWSDQYTIESNGNKYDSGVALLKVIIRESHLDTNATTNSIRTKLSNLDTYITTVNSDIGLFNQHVKMLIQSLTARNQETSDLLINLFKGYSAVSDETFRAWLGRKQDDHEEGEELTPDALMMAAKNKYDAMVEKGTWNAPTNEEKIVALEAKLTSKIKDLKKVQFEKNKKAGGTQQSNTKAKSKTNDTGGDHPKNWPPPKAGDKMTVKHNGNDWHWCGKETGGQCEKWRAHDPKKCEGRAFATNKRPAANGADAKKKGKPFQKKLKVARAYVAKLEKRAETAASDDDSD